MRIREGIKYDFDDVLIVPQRSDSISRLNIEIQREFEFPHSPMKIKCVPLIASNMATVGTFRMAESLARQTCLTCLHKHYHVDQLVDWFVNNQTLWDYVFYSVGISNDDMEKLKAVREKIHAQLGKVIFPRLLCIDVPNGYSTAFIEKISMYREALDGEHQVVLAGNVVTPNMAEEIILKGGDIVKVGIGSGSVCTTRLKAGVGFPQLSAVSECSFAVHGKPNGHICSDGGCTKAGDIAKAFAGGADFVMLGGMLAGTDECDGQWEYESVDTDKVDVVSGKKQYLMQKKGLKFFGMSSEEAQDKFYGGIADYRASEGKSVVVPYRGIVAKVVKDILGGVRSACTYVGARRIKDIPKCAEFVRVSRTHNTVFGG